MLHADVLPSTAVSAAILSALALALLLLVVSRALASHLRARKHDGLRVFTFANHKGGVGKTTAAFFVAQELAREDPQRQVLVVDCSIYGDITRLLLGTAGDMLSAGDAERRLVEERKTFEDYSSAVQRVRSGVFAFLHSGVPDARAHVHALSGTVASAPKNLHLMTSRTQWLNGPSCPAGAGAGASDSEPLQTDDAIAATAQALRASLASGDERWVVLIDTDGGLLHGLTKFALCVADSVIVPTNADTADLRRLRVMLRFLDQLHAAGATTATIGMCFFNALKVQANAPSDKMARLGLPFSVQEDVYKEMERVCDCLRALQAEFSHLLPHAIDGLDAAAADYGGRRAAAFFAGVRHGGVTLQRVKGKPYAEELSEAVGGDFAELCKRISQLASARTLSY
jgi:MinD-like ATPase involved in chromosome partitioning or flagellar assembly